jgi:muramoyltetrapeptide carboxypeptidase LdcA involved in peptidoglycan recycling
MGMKQFIALPKLKPGDQVAVVSPSAGLPGLFPWVQDLGLSRMRDVLGLVPVEYPTTRQMGASLEDRARDLQAAFRDPANKAVFTSIGGSDQIKLIKHLDPQVFLDYPKPFFGYSDNTHLHNFLWGLGIPSYYGGAVMTQLAMQGSMQQMTVDSLRHALFDSGEYPLAVSDTYNDQGLDWADKANLDKNRLYEPNDGLFWDGEESASGVLWGGCVESLIVQSSSGKYLPSVEDLEGCILYLETAEDIPEQWIIQYLLTGFGERGYLDAVSGVLIGRPKAWEFDQQNSPRQKADYRAAQRSTALETIRQYNATTPVVQNLDFGHTDPQLVLPSGRSIRIDPVAKQIFANY